MKRKPSLLPVSSLLFLVLVLSPAVAHAIYPFPVSSAVAETAAYIVWRTDVAGSSQVNYGLTAGYGSSTTPSSSLVTYHAQTITGLAANTTYHYQVVSTDASSNTVSSADYTFTTLAAPTGTVKTVKPSGGDYTSIQACANAASAGWTCEVYAGNSDTAIISISSSHAGSAGSPVTFIAHDAVLVPGWSIGAGAAYITVEGFAISTAAFAAYETCSVNHAFSMAASGINNHICISNNYIYNIYDGQFVRSSYQVNTSYNQVLNNVMAFADVTNTSPPFNHPCATTNGGQAGVEIWGNYNLIDGNDISEADHLIEVQGSYNVFRRNVGHDTSAADWGAEPTLDHVDFFHPLNGTSGNGAHTIHNVIENNQEYNTNYPDQHFLLAEGAGDTNSQSLGTGDGSTRAFGGTLSLSNPNGTDTGIAPFSVIVVVGSGAGTVAAVDNGFGGLTGAGVTSGSVNNATGALSVTFSAAPASGAPVSANYKLLTLGTHDLIVRYNSAYYLGEYFINGSDGGFPGIRAYNNTMVHIGFGDTGSQDLDADYEFLASAGALVPHWTVMNSIYDDSWKYVNGGTPWTNASNVTAPPAQVPGYGLAYDHSCAPTCSYTAATTSAPGMITNRDPGFNNVSVYDFSLKAGSPALNAGTYLATVASTDTGSGTSLIVSDAGFFQDGYGIVQADWIAVGTVSNIVQIGSINYATNTITLATSISRSPGNPVWLAKDSTGRTVLVGSGPNIGATFATSGVVPVPPTNLTAIPH